MPCRGLFKRSLHLTTEMNSLLLLLKLTFHNFDEIVFTEPIHQETRLIRKSSLKLFKYSLLGSVARYCLIPVLFFFTYVIPFPSSFITHDAMRAHILVLETHGNCDHPLIEIREVSFEKLAEFIVLKIHIK